MSVELPHQLKRPYNTWVELLYRIRAKLNVHMHLDGNSTDLWERRPSPTRSIHERERELRGAETHSPGHMSLNIRAGTGLYLLTSQSSALHDMKYHFQSWAASRAFSIWKHQSILHLDHLFGQKYIVGSTWTHLSLWSVAPHPVSWLLQSQTKTISTPLKCQAKSLHRAGKTEVNLIGVLERMCTNERFV